MFHQRSRTFFNEKEEEIRNCYYTLRKYCLSTTIQNSYEFSSIISFGSNSQLILGVEKNEKNPYAIKNYHYEKAKDKNQLIENIVNEIKIGNCLDHPNIIKFYQMFYSDSNIYLILEYVEGIELFNLIDSANPFTEEETKKIIYKLILILKFIHSKNIIHRDLKPENIMISNKHDTESIKIVDLGLATFINKDEKLSKACGTPGYVAPEILNYEGYDQKADIFSLGVICFAFLTWTPLFKGNSILEILKENKLCQIDYSNKRLQNISVHALNFLTNTLERNPSKRISAKEAENHRWFKSENFNFEQGISANIKKNWPRSGFM